MSTQIINGIAFTASQWPPEKTKPVLLLIHGATLSKTFWEDQIHGLTDICTPVAVDLPGHGESAGKAPDSIEAFSQCIVDFIQSAGLNGHDIVLCGLSMGGAIVQRLLLSDPDIFKAGILMNTGAKLKVHPMVLESVKHNYRQFVLSMPALSFAPGSNNADLNQRIKGIVGQNTSETAINDFNACHHFDVMGEVESISCPILVFSAEHDISTPPKFGYWLSEHIPNAVHVHVDRAGHLSPMEMPEKINQEIKQFLAGLK